MIPEFSFEFMHTFGPMLANHLWQSTVVALMAWGLSLLLRRNQARVRYWIWLTASMKFFVPFAFLIGFGGLTAGSRSELAAPSRITVAMDQVGQPFSQPVLHSSIAMPGPKASDTLPLIAGVVWLCGFTSIVAVWLVRWRRVAQMVRHTAPLREGREINALHRVTAKPLPLALSPMRIEPGVFGIWRPVLLWPEGISDYLDDAHIEAILAHELRHVERRDNLTALLHMGVEAVFWFHPLVWLVGARLVEERERACDEDVLLAGGRPHVYAESILKTCQFCLESPLRCVSGITGADLKGRVAEIMAKRSALKMGFGRKALLAVAGAVVVIAPVVLGQAKASQESAQIELGDVRYDVATIKRSDPNATWMSAGPRANQVYVSLNMPLKSAICDAYDVLPLQCVGGPAWIDADKYDIEAKPDSSTTEQLLKLSSKQRSSVHQRMFQALLADRLKLKVHFETREMSIFALEVAKGGLKMHEAEVGNTYKDGLKFGDGKPLGAGGFTWSYGRMTAQALLLDNLAVSLSSLTHRLVENKTGLTGRYDFTVHYSGEEPPPADSSEPSIYTALEEQLGLKLVSTKGPVKVLVIDSVERPSEN